MPKASWGGGITQADIDNAETKERVTYDGPLPVGAGLAVEIKSAKQTESKAGNPMLKLLLVVDTKSKQHSKFQGAPIWDQLVIGSSSAWKIKAFCDAIGVTSKQFLENTVLDEDKNVTKIGTKKIVGMHILINTRREAEEGYDPKAVVRDYLPRVTGEAVAEAPAEEAPAEAKAKGGKAKKGGKKAAADDQPPF